MNPLVVDTRVYKSVTNGNNDHKIVPACLLINQQNNAPLLFLF